MAGWIKRVGVGVVGVVVLAALGGGAAYAWASTTADQVMARSYAVHEVDLPVPWPLSEAELEALRAEAGDPVEGIDPDAIALERAVERGEHLVEARFVCVACHGADFGGGVMVEDPLLGSLLGPNLTHGEGGVTAAYTMADWDRIVRHGVKPDGTAAVMPSEDFVGMSDQELSDIVAYIRSRRPVDRTVEASTLGPLGRVLVATGQLPWSAQRIDDHQAAHTSLPPPPGETEVFGRHLSRVCVGCHNPGLTGGPIIGGAPDWPPAANLTPAPGGLEGWTYDQFRAAMLDGVRPDGTALRPPMTDILPFAANWSETEMRALWVYLQSLEPTTVGGRG